MNVGGALATAQRRTVCPAEGERRRPEGRHRAELALWTHDQRRPRLFLRQEAAGAVMPPERSRHHVERAAAGEVCGSPGRVCGPRVRRWACGVERVAQGRSHARTATHGAICFACGDHSGRRWCSLASGRGGAFALSCGLLINSVLNLQCSCNRSRISDVYQRKRDQGKGTKEKGAGRGIKKRVQGKGTKEKGLQKGIKKGEKKGQQVKGTKEKDQGKGIAKGD